jgi:hypothetical protein
LTANARNILRLCRAGDYKSRDRQRKNNSAKPHHGFLLKVRGLCHDNTTQIGSRQRITGGQRCVICRDRRDDERMLSRSGRCPLDNTQEPAPISTTPKNKGLDLTVAITAMRSWRRPSSVARARLIGLSVRHV